MACDFWAFLAQFDQVKESLYVYLVSIVACGVGAVDITHNLLLLTGWHVPVTSFRYFAIMSSTHVGIQDVHAAPQHLNWCPGRTAKDAIMCTNNKHFACFTRSLKVPLDYARICGCLMTAPCMCTVLLALTFADYETLLQQSTATWTCHVLSITIDHLRQLAVHHLRWQGLCQAMQQAQIGSPETR